MSKILINLQTSYTGWSLGPLLGCMNSQRGKVKLLQPGIGSAIFERKLITLPALARENNNSPPARTAAANAAIYCIYNALKIRAYNEHFRMK